MTTSTRPIPLREVADAAIAREQADRDFCLTVQAARAGGAALQDLAIAAGMTPEGIRGVLKRAARNRAEQSRAAQSGGDRVEHEWLSERKPAA